MGWIVNSQTQKSKNINSVYMETVGLGGIDGRYLTLTSIDFTNEFGGIEQPMFKHLHL